MDKQRMVTDMALVIIILPLVRNILANFKTVTIMVLALVYMTMVHHTLARLLIFKGVALENVLGLMDDTTLGNGAIMNEMGMDFLKVLMDL